MVCSPIHLDNLRAIKHNERAVNVHATFQFDKELLSLAQCHCLWHLLYCDSASVLWQYRSPIRLSCLHRPLKDAIMNSLIGALNALRTNRHILVHGLCNKCASSASGFRAAYASTLAPYRNKVRRFVLYQQHSSMRDERPHK